MSEKLLRLWSVWQSSNFSSWLIGLSNISNPKPAATLPIFTETDEDQTRNTESGKEKHVTNLSPFTMWLNYLQFTTAFHV